MFIEKLSVENFKLFRKETFVFNQRFSLIIGINGVGKTSVLEAAAVALGGYLAAFEGIKGRNIYTEDIRRDYRRLGDATVTKEPQVPVVVECTGTMNGQRLSWKRVRDKVVNGRTLRQHAKEVLRLGEAMQQDVRSGNQKAVLPVLSYQSAGRLFSQKKDRWYNPFAKDELSRFLGYTDCLDTESDIKLFGNWIKKMTQIQIQKNKKIGELHAVLGAVSQFMTLMSDDGKELSLYFDLEENETMIELGDSHSIPLRKMSAGYRSIIGMVAEIAFRMAILNPQLKEQAVQLTPGVVLIDEIDLHLHPKWQWKIVEALKMTFPKVQFIATTHAPIVIASCREGELLEIARTDDPHDVEQTTKSTPFGWSIEDILTEIMNTKNRAPEVASKIDRIERLYLRSLQGKLAAAEEHELGSLSKELYRLLPQGDPVVTMAKIRAIGEEVKGESSDG